MKTSKRISGVNFIFTLLQLSICFNFAKAQQYSYFGHEVPVNTAITGQPLTVLLVFAEMVGVCPDGDNPPYWSPGSLPITASQIIDPYPSNSPTGLISKYFYDMSFGQFQVIGDYIDHVVPVPCTGTVQQNFNNVLNAIGANLTFANYTGLGDFDKYTLNQGHFYNKLPNPDNKVDVIIVCYRNSPNQGCLSGYGCGTTLIQNQTVAGYGFNTGCSFGMCGDLSQAEFILEEFFHDMYGSNNWHLGAEKGNWTFPFGTSPWGISTQMTATGQSRIVAGWDRQFCSWYGWADVNKTVTKQELISAIDPLTGNEISTDFQNITFYPNAMEFIMRDFVTYGDAIKIKLPHINYFSVGDTKNQYIWLENHQLIESFDHSWGVGSGCNTPWVPGLYSQIQVGKDRDGNNSGPIETTDFREPNFAGSWLYPLTAEGNYDFVFGTPYDDNPNNSACIWNHTALPIYPFDPNTLPNPLTGYSKLHSFYNTNGDNKLDRFTDTPVPWTAEYDVTGTNLLFTWFSRGSDKVAFNNQNGNKISIATNPAPTPVYTYLTGDAGALLANPNQPDETYENRTVWLNGISIEVLQENVAPILYGPGAMKVRVRFEDYEVDRDVRWCAGGDFSKLNQGGIKLSANDFNSANPSLVVKQNKTIHIDQGRSDTHCWATGTDQGGNNIFTLTTIFTCLPNSFATLETSSKIIVDNGSILKLQDQSKIILQAGAQIIVRNNSKLILESGSFLQLNSGAKVIVENGSTLEYYPNAEIQLNGVYSSLEIAGLLDLKDYSDFTFSYNTNLHGFVLFNSPQPLPLNIHAGLNCTISLNGSSQFRKVLEVAQEGLYPPSNLIAFSIQQGTVELHAATRILPLGWQTFVSFDNVKLTSDNLIYNGHLGLQMVGQYHSITNSIFENGKFGIHYIATLSRNDFFASDCTFRNCKEGLFTSDKGAHLTRCHFTGNSVLGWNTGIMSNPSEATEGDIGGTIAGSNYQGLYYYANNMAPLSLRNPNITYNNTSGVQVERTLVKPTCGTISYNLNEGIILGKAATLQMDNGANVTCVGNAFTIALAHANYLFLYKGNNDLTPLQPQTYTAVAGTLISPGPYPIIADQNRWNGVPNLTPLDYGILYNGVSVTMTDANPQNIIPPCGQAIPAPPPAPGGPNDPLSNCEECDVINTEDFSNEKLNEATLTAIEKAGDNTAGNYIEAVNLFSQILMEDYANPNNKEKYLLSLNYLKMLDALGNAFGAGQLTWQQNISTIDVTTQKVIDVLNKLIDVAIDGNNYSARLIYNFDKAAVFRLADRRELGLDVLYSVSNWIVQEDADELSRIVCIYDLENQALLGSLPPEAMYSALNNCGISQGERMGHFMSSNTASKVEELRVDIYPNPATTEITIITNVQQGESMLANSIGQKVYNGKFSNEAIIDISNFPKGIYSLEITNKETGRKKIQKVVIQ